MTALLQLPKYRKIPGVNQWMNEYTNYNTYISQNISQPQKRNEVLMHAITQVNCANAMSEFAQS